VEGRPDIAGLFRDTAGGETGHAHGHFDVRFPVGGAARLLLDLEQPAELVVNHPNYQHRTAVTDSVRLSLAADLEEKV
jgi:hypothetical protein